MVKNPPANAGDLGLIPDLGRSPGEGNATYSGILAWEIPWTEGPGRLQFLRLKRVRHDLVTKQKHGIWNAQLTVFLCLLFLCLLTVIKLEEYGD